MARRNALKHNLSEGGVVILGEHEQEVVVRVAALETQWVPEGDALGALLIRQVAIASIRSERAFRTETALAAERMRQAAANYEDERLARVEQCLGELSGDPARAWRRLLAEMGGIDALIKRLRCLRERTESCIDGAWDDKAGKALDQILGKISGQALRSRVERLTWGIVDNQWAGPDLTGWEGMDDPTRLRWAMGQIQAIIDDELRSLATLRSNLETTPTDRGRAEAGERSLVDLGAEGTALRRYAGAAERMMLQAVREIRLARAVVHVAEPSPAATVPILETAATEVPARPEVRGELASFGSEPGAGSR